jgi:hypothetical protein
MPYIAKDRRTEVHKQGFAWNGAELNYLICYHIDKFLRNRAVTQDLRYADFAEALSAVEGAKREFQRCVIDPYESMKRMPGKIIPATALDNEPLFSDLLPRDPAAPTSGT